MKAELYNLKNEKVGAIELPDSAFNVRWNESLVHQMLQAFLANQREPWAHAKGRGEVRGGGRKPWRQKGTGRARHGSTRSPIWIGGGKAHGPIKTRDYSQKTNKKMKRLAVFSVLSRKLKDGEVRFFDSLDTGSSKTKMLSDSLKPILGLSKRSKKMDLLIIPDVESKSVGRAARNLVKTKVSFPDSINIYDIMNFKNIFIDQKAVEKIVKHFKV